MIIRPYQYFALCISFKITAHWKFLTISQKIYSFLKHQCITLSLLSVDMHGVWKQIFSDFHDFNVEATFEHSKIFAFAKVGKQ